jgi:membrane protease YdiL (CAAX protease family)
VAALTYLALALDERRGDERRLEIGSGRPTSPRGPWVAAGRRDDHGSGTPASRRDALRHGRLLPFFVITFAFSWLLWLLPVLRSNGLSELPEAVGLLGMLAPFGPSAAAFWLVSREMGIGGVRALWLRGWRAGPDRKWLIPALGLGPMLALATVAAVVVTGGSVDWAAGVPPLMILPVFGLIYFANALPEEYGWRGYALDPLQQRFSALGASLALGLIWGMWHLPLVFIEGTTQAAIPFYEFVLQTMLLAVLYTWLFNNTGGSVLVVALFHASANTAAAAVPTWTTEFGRWSSFAFLAVFVGWVLWRWGWRQLTGSTAGT